jgi:hypothetical protein
MEELIINYNDSKEYREGRVDASFYVFGDGGGTHEQTASVTYGDRTINIYRDGEMRYLKWSSIEAKNNGEDPTVIRYSDRLIESGITNDEQLYKAIDIELIEMDNNPWFDLYDDNDEHLDCVCDTLESAVTAASAMIKKNTEVK